jgi:hypothetical protein
MKRRIRSSLAPILVLGIAGCASTPELSTDSLPISVSAANYSQVSGEELYARISAADNNHPAPPPVAEPAKPLFYAFVPIDYTPYVPLETIYRELATPLAQRGYFNIVYQIKAGLPPKRIDYLLRIYCGRRFWRTPTVRTDKVTWGNDDLVYSWRGAAPSGTANLIGTNSLWDSRVGMSPSEIANLAMDVQQGQGSIGTMGSMGNMGGGKVAFSEQQRNGFQDLSGDAASRFYWLVMVEAFRFEDVRDRKRDAPCVWSTLVAMPFRQGLDSVKVIRTMARTAIPYFGTTADGLQVFEVSPGRVLMGEPVEAPGPQKAPQSMGQGAP